MCPSPPDERRPATQRNAAERRTAPLSADSVQNRNAVDALNQWRQSWVDEVFEEYARCGGLEQLPGLGKPLVVPTGDPLDTLLKNANVQPPWIMLRSETKKLMAQAVEMLDRGPSFAAEIEELIGHINKLIVEMNGIAPSLSLHRPRVTRKTLREQYEKWL